MTGDRFRCQPLRCLMSVQSCARRHERCRGTGEAPCGSCNVGIAHAAGKPTPAHFLEVVRGFDIEQQPASKDFGVGVCPWCGARFDRTTGNHGFCSRRHAKAYYRAAARNAVPAEVLQRIRASVALSGRVDSRCKVCRQPFRTLVSRFEKLCPVCRVLSQVRARGGSEDAKRALTG